ncbi:MAG: hypothetical protein OXI38_06515 [Bacteroidota bacterium]|nr:hypothetical protein [Bacteroidota bacterium]
MKESQRNPELFDTDLIGDMATKHGKGANDPFASLSKSDAVGQVLMRDYDTATLVVHDFHRERAGGLARGMFLIGGSPVIDEKASFVLMRVAGAKRLANHAATDEARITAVRETIGQEIWSKKLNKWIADEIALGGVEARILGTLDWRRDADLRFAEDIANYYSAHGDFVWKPTGALLELIVNLTHRGNSLDLSGLDDYTDVGIRIRIAESRFSAAKAGDDKKVRVPVLMNPTDLLKRRTAFFGMSRSGKSNAMKITA